MSPVDSGRIRASSLFVGAARSPQNHRRPMMILSFAIAFTVVRRYWFQIRRWMGHWGITSSDLTRVMAGDGLVVDPTFSYTMAITINARPEHIWPWLVQLGYQRGGLYSYDWL